MPAHADNNISWHHHGNNNNPPEHNIFDKNTSFHQIFEDICLWLNVILAGKMDLENFPMK